MENLEKFNIKRIYGYYWMAFVIVLETLIFITCLIITIVFIVDYHISPNSFNIHSNLEVVRNCLVLMLPIILIMIITLSIFSYKFLPFINSKGKKITVRITQREISAMYGEIEKEDINQRVKIRFVNNVFIDCFKFYREGDYISCFIKEEDFDNPKVVVFYL